jgi:DNA-directed RNA polymerase subunit alpha
VTYTIENTRVGQRTDYEKLILEIWTDGSITPEDALTFAGRNLRDHIQLFINFDVKPEKEEEEDIDEETLQIRKLLRKPVEELELSVRSANCLRKRVFERSAIWFAVMKTKCSALRILDASRLWN